MAVSFELTIDQAASLAPDSGTLKRAKGLATFTKWESYGISESALWGECRGTGSKPYMVKIDIRHGVVGLCSCPVRKPPCKHTMALLLLYANHPGNFVPEEAPEWVQTWITGREKRRKQKDEKIKQQEQDPEYLRKQERSRKKRQEKRIEEMEDGIARLNLWLQDRIREGLATVEQHPRTIWSEQSRRMIDSKAKGFANRLNDMSEIPGSSKDWPENLLISMGRTALLARAFLNRHALEPDLAQTIMQMTGMSVREEDVLRNGESQVDTWMVLGQIVRPLYPRGKEQRTWLLGISSNRIAQHLAFIFEENLSASFVPGTCFEAECVFYPGVSSQRVAIRNRKDTAYTPPPALPGHRSIGSFLEEVTDQIALNPFKERFSGLLNNVLLTYKKSTHEWYLLDEDGLSLPLARKGAIRAYWSLFAMYGGESMDIAFEYSNGAVHPIGALANGSYTHLGGEIL